MTQHKVLFNKPNLNLLPVPRYNSGLLLRRVRQMILLKRLPLSREKCCDKLSRQDHNATHKLEGGHYVVYWYRYSSPKRCSLRCQLKRNLPCMHKDETRSCSFMTGMILNIVLQILRPPKPLAVFISEKPHLSLNSKSPPYSEPAFT